MRLKNKPLRFQPGTKRATGHLWKREAAAPATLSPKGSPVPAPMAGQTAAGLETGPQPGAAGEFYPQARFSAAVIVLNNLTVARVAFSSLENRRANANFV